MERDFAAYLFTLFCPLFTSGASFSIAHEYSVRNLNKSAAESKHCYCTLLEQHCFGRAGACVRARTGPTRKWLLRRPFCAGSRDVWTRGRPCGCAIYPRARRSATAMLPCSTAICSLTIIQPASPAAPDDSSFLR